MTKPLIPAPWRFTPPDKMRLIDVRSTADLASHADEWAELLLQSPAASPMLSYPQISAFFETQTPTSNTWFCLFAYEGDQLVGVFPLIATRSYRALGFSILHLKTPYNILHTSGVDCLTLHGREEIIEVFVDYLSSIPRTWPLIRMRDVPNHSPSMIYLNRGGTKVRAVQRLCGSENYIEVPKSYEAYHSGFSSNFRRQLKRGSRKLDELENVRFLCRDDSRPAAENVKRFEEIEASGWKGCLGFTIKAIEGSSRFYTLAAERFREHGWMEWNFLETGERTIGAHYGVRIKRTLFLLKISYDDEFSACSPGNLLLEKAIQHACKTGDLDEINCVADCAWHRNWNMKKRMLHDLIILPKIPVISALLSSILNSKSFHKLKGRFFKESPTTEADQNTPVSPNPMPDTPTTRSISQVQAAMLRGSLVRTTGENVEQVEIDFATDVPIDQVVAAWTATVARTAALRVGFVIRDGEPCGLIPVTVAVPFQFERNIPESWETWLASDRVKPFPLDGGLPWRAVIWPEARKLVWTLHHALLDGRSITKILTAFQARLTGAKDPGDLDLAASPRPGPDEIAEALTFHRNAFAELEASPLEFPAEQGNAPASAHRILGLETVARIESVASAMEVTVPTMITWAWGQAVATAAGADAVAIGQVRSGPPTPGLAGFSMNTVPLVIQRAGPGPIQPVLVDFRNRLLAMRSIEIVSVEELSAGIFRETGGPWPGGVLMVERGTMHHQVGKSQAIGSIKLHEHSGELLLASAWIHPELRLEVEVNGAPLSGGAAESLLDHWAAILTALADGVTADAEEISALPAAMRETLRHWETGGEPSAHLHLATAWREAAETFAGRCALWTPEAPVSYAELAAQVEHLAACLQDAGVKPGQTVASLLQTRKHLPVVLLALARLGAINVPLDPALPEKRLRTIIDDAGPLRIISDSPDACAGIHLPCIAVDGSTGKTCTANLPNDPRDTLSILYTSGSTGTPKGVMMVHGGVTNEVRGIAKLARIGPESRVLQFASPGFDASLEELLATLLSGATLVPRPEELSADLDHFQNFIQNAGITVLDLSTAHWAAWCAWMASENATIPQNIKTTIIGGERASAAALKDWFTAGGRQHLLVNTYGPTEASIVGTAELIGTDWNESGDPAIGYPLPGVFARISDASGRRLPQGAAGELWLGGICVGSGYWQRPDLTECAFHFIDGRWWYRTGDRVCRDDDGKLRFLGRQDDQLKIRGNRIEPNEVIRVLETYPGVSAAHAGPMRGHEGATLLAAWVRWNHTPQEGWPGLLAEHAAIHLPTAAIPTRWAAVEDFKLTERGKLDRHQLPEPLLTASTHASSDPPATVTEKLLAAWWSELLGIETIGRDESFFELGGHSLAALQLFARIARKWKIRIPMAALIQAPSPRLLGDVIDRKNSGQDPLQGVHSVVVPVRSGGHLPPLFCIHGGDGGIFFYRDLAEHLPPGRPLLAIESPALAADEAVYAIPVEQTAATYVTALRKHQARGPFHLAGYSYGGLLVFEVARQLISEGETVAFAGLFDTVNPAASIRNYSLMERAGIFWESHNSRHWSDKVIRLLARARDGISTHIRVRKEIRSVRNAGITEPHSDLRMLQIREAHWESMMNYQPSHLDCHITLFKSQATDDKFDIPEDYGWGGLVNSMEIIPVQGKHLTMFGPHHVAALAEEINKRL